MKTNLTFFFLFIFSAITVAQQGINYKAIVKDGSGSIVANDLIQVQFAILEGATSVYSETHSPTTDANGLIILNIGEGTPITGTFDAIDWANDAHFLNVQINTGDGLTDMGTTEFKTVPYAITSGDAVFKKDGDNAFKEDGNIGIGTADPTEQLHINDDTDARMLLSANNTFNRTSMRLENGDAGGTHSYFKIENFNDQLRIGVDSDLTAGTGYNDIVTISTSGNITTDGALRLGTGPLISEFSTDGTLSGNSSNAVPTESAVKTYVDNMVGTEEKSIIIPATAFTGNTNVNPIILQNFGAFAQKTTGNGFLVAPLILPEGSTVTSMRFFLRDGTYLGNENLQASLLRGLRTSTIFSIQFSVSTFGGSTSGFIETYDTDFTILNDYQYVIRISPTSTWTHPDMGVCAVEVTYID
ncbi:hypothetical protein [Cochleicola gelatinilyticus]|uniref:Uncharacterized protein n=1 Tax=Cochleicola gelatinilyticus TaxID=1763537 RepID=A0A167HJW5_9FLAO|nr:hypothetical protein [Cochleicola gelatinilyticus]OAB78687.1 hypothetical protein ULVI_08885 [Cochleicola gelatinilyticus]